MTLDDALPLVTHQLTELRTAAREDALAMDAGADPVPGSPDWGQHAMALEIVMRRAGLQVPA